MHRHARGGHACRHWRSISTISTRSRAAPTSAAGLPTLTHTPTDKPTRLLRRPPPLHCGPNRRPSSSRTTKRRGSICRHMMPPRARRGTVHLSHHRPSSVRWKSFPACSAAAAISATRILTRNVRVTARCRWARVHMRRRSDPPRPKCHQQQQQRRQHRSHPPQRQLRRRRRKQQQQLP